MQGKSDPLDAENAARAVLAGTATATPKDQNGACVAIRMVSVVRRSAVKAKTQAMNQIRALLVSAPQDIRERLWRTKPHECAKACLSVRSLGTTELFMTLMTTLKLLAKRWTTLAEELNQLDKNLDSLTQEHCKNLSSRMGNGSWTICSCCISHGCW
jgi:transposase